jgi:two-component system response regulator GlrR
MTQLRKLPLFAACDATVLITGETGTGKELCARAVHYLSNRSSKPFVVVDCGAISADLIENELFGHEKGSYTTALTAQSGLIQESAGGSLFLDEIDSLSLPMQSKLLRFLQEKEYRPLGSPKPHHVDVRVIAASNKSLEEAVHAGRFRQDLYYRLNVLSLQIPPLRDRREDIPLLARHFLEKFAAEFYRPARDFTEGAIRRLLTYQWPGNARELENIIERAYLLSDNPMIDACHLELPSFELDNAGITYQARKDRMVAKWEVDELKRMLITYRGNVSAAARVEGKAPNAIRALLRKHHLRPTCETPHWFITT